VGVLRCRYEFYVHSTASFSLMPEPSSSEPQVEGGGEFQHVRVPAAWESAWRSDSHNFRVPPLGQDEYRHVLQDSVFIVCAPGTRFHDVRVLLRAVHVSAPRLCVWCLSCRNPL